MGCVVQSSARALFNWHLVPVIGVYTAENGPTLSWRSLAGVALVVPLRDTSTTQTSQFMEDDRFENHGEDNLQSFIVGEMLSLD